MASDEQSKQPQSETAKSAGGTAKAEAGQTKQAGSGQAAGAAATDAITLLKNDHREVEKLFAEYEKASNRSRKQAIIQQVAQMLKVHSELEEAIFYPAVRQQAEADDKLDEAQVEHDTLKILIADLEQDGSSEFRDAKVKVLSEYVKHHVQEEEASGGILEQGRKGGLDLKELGEKMAQLKQELESDPSQLRAEPVSLQQFGQSQRRGASSGMQRSQGGGRGMQERDEQGRFMEERGEGGRQFQGGGYRGGSSRSEPEYRGSEGRGGGQGQGWHGDPRGHSEAARRGWEEREQSGTSRGGRGYGDDDRRSGSSRGGGMRGEGQGGWFGDPQGHSEAARRGWQHRDDDDRGGRSRGGYPDDGDDRGYYRSRQDDEDDRRYRSRPQRDDDDDGRERGGWFGDPRGHSEAARRGWDHRR